MPGRDAGEEGASGGIVTMEGKREPKAAFPACVVDGTWACLDQTKKGAGTAVFVWGFVLGLMGELGEQLAGGRLRVVWLDFGVIGGRRSVAGIDSAVEERRARPEAVGGALRLDMENRGSRASLPEGG